MAHTRRLIWLPAALRDLERLDSFVRPHNPDAASRALAAIRKAAISILPHPERGRPYDPALGFRDLVIPFGWRSYVLRYRLDEDTVVIVRIWHALEERP